MFKFQYFLLPAALASFVTTAGFASSDVIEDGIFLTRTVHMGHADTSPIKLGSQGWSGPEGTHRWSNSENAALIIPRMDGERSLFQVKINMIPLANEKHWQNIAVFNRFDLEGQIIEPSEINCRSYASMTPISVSVNILDRLDTPIFYVLEENEVIHFVMRDACKPEVIDPNNSDPRTLAVALTTVELKYRKSLLGLKGKVDTFLSNVQDWVMKNPYLRPGCSNVPEGWTLQQYRHYAQQKNRAVSLLDIDASRLKAMFEALYHTPATLGQSSMYYPGRVLFPPACSQFFDEFRRKYFDPLNSYIKTMRLEYQEYIFADEMRNEIVTESRKQEDPISWKKDVENYFALSKKNGMHIKQIEEYLLSIRDIAYRQELDSHYDEWAREKIGQEMDALEIEFDQLKKAYPEQPAQTETFHRASSVYVEPSVSAYSVQPEEPRLTEAFHEALKNHFKR